MRDVSMVKATSLRKLTKYDDKYEQKQNDVYGDSRECFDDKCWLLV